MYKITIVDANNEIRESTICAASELDQCLRRESAKCAQGERCVYRRFG